MKEYKLKINDNNYSVVIKDVTDDAVLAEVNGIQHLVQIDTVANLPQVASISDSERSTADPAPQVSLPGPSVPKAGRGGAGNIVTPIPGQIISINVTPGEKVRTGQKLLVLEAMKLENSIIATLDGTVLEIFVSEGDVVGQGQTLITLN